MTLPLTPSRREQLAARHASLSKQRDNLAALPAAADRDVALRQLDGLLQQIDALIRPKPKKVAKPRARRPAPTYEQVAEIARLRKDASTEVRISVKEWQGRRAVDIRQWCSGGDGAEWRPTSKGVFINAPLAEGLISALQGALQHLPES